MTTHALHRDGFHALKEGGLNWDSFPLRLFTKGNGKHWNPADIDFSQDALDFAALSDVERDSTVMLMAQFIAGEEAVTQDLQPFMSAMAAEGRIGDEMYLTQFCYEEAKHVEVFRRALDALGVTHDLHQYVADNPGYRTIFYEELPTSMRLLRDDPSPRNQIRASVTYNHVVEGVLALTGYFSFHKVCTANGIMPGVQEMVKRIGDDERRHMAWGTFTCRRHVAADDANWDVVNERMQELLPHALAMIQWSLDQYEDGEIPFDLDPNEFITYAASRAGRRLGAIESARGVPLHQIDVDAAPEELEEQFGREDEAELAAARSD